MSEMATKILSSRLLVHQAARALDQDDPQKIILAAMAKKCNLTVNIGC